MFKKYDSDKLENGSKRKQLLYLSLAVSICVIATALYSSLKPADQQLDAEPS